jgi:hypothetical protein
MTPPEQTGAPVLGFSTPTVAPGGTAYAVIATPYPDVVEQWRREAVPGVVLPMYEGNRVCGHGTVLWRTDVNLPLSPEQETRFRRWLYGPVSESWQAP